MQTKTSWVNIDDNSDFTIYNFPFGIGIIQGKSKVVSRIGDSIIDLSILAKSGLIQISNPEVLENEYLNEYIDLGKKETVSIRAQLIELYSDESNKNNAQLALFDYREVKMTLPIKITDYTDFYSSREHATNVGMLFRDPENALLPNWLHLPVGYHGRASSIIVSGTEIKRPSGQTRPDKSKPPVFGKSRLLDFELELGFVIGKKTDLGDTVSTKEAEDHIFGVTLFNDWSARDIQGWEYVPLGPFLGKNFASTMSPWIVTLEALDPFRLNGPVQDPKVLPYLQYEGQRNYDIDLFVNIETSDGINAQVCHSNFQYMYWNMTQQLAHHTVNGCNINVGDLYASGTISGKEKSSYGSMLELTWRGTQPIELAEGVERKFIKDGDTVQLRGKCSNGVISLGFGECDGKIIA